MHCLVNSSWFQQGMMIDARPRIVLVLMVGIPHAKPPCPQRGGGCNENKCDHENTKRRNHEKRPDGWFARSAVGTVSGPFRDEIGIRTTNRTNRTNEEAEQASCRSSQSGRGERRTLTRSVSEGCRKSLAARRQRPRSRFGLVCGTTLVADLHRRVPGFPRCHRREVSSPESSDFTPSALAAGLRPHPPNATR